MNINWIFVFISIIITAWDTEGLPSPIDTQVTAFEYKTYSNAPREGSDACNAFFRGFHHEPNSAYGEPNYLQIDCDRYSRSLACYQDIQNQAGTQTANGQPVEKDYLSTEVRTQIEQACAELKNSN